MLAEAQLQTIVRTSRIAEAERFYSEVLGLPLKANSAWWGVILERFAAFPHDPRGVLTTPDGAQVAWLRDPDGNLLPIVQYA